MNGYQMIADQYKRHLEVGNPTEEARKEMESKIKALEFLAGADQKTRFSLFDSGAFNGIVKGFLLMAVDNVELPEGCRLDLLHELSQLFDTVSADQADRYFRTH